MFFIGWCKSQLMVNWWFGLVLWIPGITLWKGWLLRGTPGIQNHQAPNHQFAIISWCKSHQFIGLPKNAKTLQPRFAFMPRVGESQKTAKQLGVKRVWWIVPTFANLLPPLPIKIFKCEVFNNDQRDIEYLNIALPNYSHRKLQPWKITTRDIRGPPQCHPPTHPPGN